MIIGSCGDFYGTLYTTPERVLYTIVNVLLIIAASLLNISVTTLIRTRSVLHQPSFILLAALACNDLAMVCISGSLNLAITLMGVSKDGAIEMVTCSITSTCAVNNLLLLCCITHDRYQCINHCMDRRPYTTKRRVAVKIVLCIFASFIGSSIFTIEAAFNLPIRAVEAMLIMVSGAFCYLVLYHFKISRFVRRNRINVSSSEPQDSNEASVRQDPSYNSRLNRSIYLLIAAYVVTFFPCSVAAVIRNILYRLNMSTSDGLAMFSAWSATLSLSNALVDPLIYTYRCNVFGRELRKVLSHVLFL